MSHRPLRLLGTHWETPDLARAGWVESEYLLERAETGFVALHLWNVGEPGGPEIPERFFVDMGSREAQEESVRIARECIRPAIDAARSAGLAVFHVEPENIAMKYPSVRHMLDEPPAPSPRARPEANPGWILERAERTHGRGYRDWAGWKAMRILSSCEPEEGDQVILTGAQLDRICRSRGIRNLVYAGFAANMCILDSPAATREMLGLGYRVFLIREATLAVEYPDTFPERLMTRAALEYFQQVIGDTLCLAQFLEACR